MRIDSYESEAHQRYVRTFLDGRFENSAFCMLEPNGQTWLTRASRGPEQVLGRGNATAQLERLALQFPAKADLGDSIVQDFHSFRQALNVAAADQRVLVVVHAPQGQSELRESLKQVANDRRIEGRFHFDFEPGNEWVQKVDGAMTKPGIILVRPGEFGMTGKQMAYLPLDATASQVIETMLQANATFARTTKKKVYSEHVSRGRAQGIYFEGAVPYGEDRDGDGVIDHGGSRRGSGSSSSRGRSRGGPLRPGSPR